MKKILMLWLMFLLPALCVQADNITVGEAQSLAQAFLNSQSNVRKASGVYPPRLTLAAQLSDCYIFNRDNSAGYVIVANDDIAPQPILGYADNGQIEADHLPCNLQWMLDEYARELAWARQNGITTQTNAPAKAPVVTKAAISPLVQSHWSQNAPYNSLCPKVDGTQTVTGCVATATAQLMRYHKHPAQGTGSHSYTWNGGTLSRDFSESTYDWDNMLLDYSSGYNDAQAEAVGRLMADVGIAVDMNYSTSASGAVSRYVATALPNYFGYSSSIKYIVRSNYSLTEWMNVLYDELANDRPVYFSGSSTSGGHAFVVDGYRNGYFHINWGWGGMSDGYFLISALDPDQQGIGGSSSGYNYNQDAIIGIKPAVGGETPVAEAPLISIEKFTAYQSSISRNNSFSYWDMGNSIWNKGNKSATIFMGLKVVDEKGKTTYLASSNEVTISAGYGSLSSYMSVPLSNFPTDQTQTYKVYPAFKNSADGQWYDIVISTTGANEYLNATTDDNTVYFTAPAAAVVTLTASNVVMPTKVFAGKTFTVKADFKAQGGEYNGKVYAYTNDGQIGSATVDVDEKNSATVGISCTAPSTTGTYSLALKDKDGNVLADNLSYTVEEVPSGSASLSVSNVQFTSTLPSKLKFTAQFGCKGGFYSNEIMADVYTSDNSNCGSLSANLQTWDGNTENLEFEGTFTGTVGQSYYIRFYYVTSVSGYTTYFSGLSPTFSFTAGGAATSFENIGDLIDGAYAQYKNAGSTVSSDNRPSLSNVQVDFDATDNPATVVAVLQNGESTNVEAGSVFVVDQSQRGLMLVPSSNMSQDFDLSALKVGDKLTGTLAGNYMEQNGLPAFAVSKTAGSYTTSITIDKAGEATADEEATYPVTEIPSIYFLAKTNDKDRDGNDNVGDVTRQAYGTYLNSVVTVSGTIREQSGEYYLLQNEDDAIDAAALTRIYFTAGEFSDINLADYVGTTGNFEGLLLKRNVKEAKLSAVKRSFFNIAKIYISEQDNETRIGNLAVNGSLTSDVDIYLHRTKLVSADDGYSTICLPFSLAADEFQEAFGCDISLLAEATATVSSDGVQSFQSISTKDIEAGKPYLLKATGTQTLGNGSATTDDNYWTHIGTKSITDGTPSKVEASYSDNIVNGTFYFCGTYGKKQYTTGDDGQPTTTLIADGGSQKYQYISTTDGTLRYLPSTSTLAFNGLRAYYYFPNWSAANNNAAQPTGNKSKMAISVDGQAVTAIDGISLDNATATAPIYNLNGQLVGHSRSSLAKGVYVQNGQKFVIK